MLPLETLLGHLCKPGIAVMHVAASTHALKAVNGPWFWGPPATPHIQSQGMVPIEVAYAIYSLRGVSLEADSEIKIGMQVIY